MLLNTASPNEHTPTNAIEFTGVWYLLCRRLNHAGSILSHPATMGSRVTAVKLKVACAMRVPSVIRIAMVTNGPAMPNGAKPTRNTCAIGPTRSMSLVGT